jgi:hypothetical protein
VNYQKVGQAISMAAAPPNSQQIEQRLQELAKIADDFKAQIADLHGHLQPILAPQMAESGVGGSTPKPVVAPLAERLDALNSDLSVSVSMLREINHRIAL